MKPTAASKTGVSAQKDPDDMGDLLEYKFHIDFSKLGDAILHSRKATKENSEDIAALRVAIQGIREDKTALQSGIQECSDRLNKVDVHTHVTPTRSCRLITTPTSSLSSTRS